MNPCDLCAAACLLRNQVQVLRQVAVSPAESTQGNHPTVEGLLREVARGAREVETWSNYLMDQNALAAAEEAYLVLSRIESSLNVQRTTRNA